MSGGLASNIDDPLSRHFVTFIADLEHSVTTSLLVIADSRQQTALDLPTDSLQDKSHNYFLVLYIDRFLISFHVDYINHLEENILHDVN